MSINDSFDRVSLSSVDSWDVLDRAELPAMLEDGDDNVTAVAASLRTCSICGVLFGDLNFDHPHCDNCRLCVYCQDIARDSLITTCHCSNHRRSINRFPNDILEFSPLNVSCSGSSCSSSIENISSATEDEEDAVVAREPTNSPNHVQPTEDAEKTPTVQEPPKSSSPSTTSRPSIVNSVIEVFSFDPIEIPKIEPIPIPPLVPLDLPLINLQTNFKFWSPTDISNRRSRLNSGSSSSSSSGGGGMLAPVKTFQSPVTPFTHPRNMTSPRSNEPSLVPRTSAISCSPPGMWPLFGCPTSNWNIFDIQPKTSDISSSFSQPSNRVSDSPIITPAPYERDLPPIRSQSWDTDRIHELIRPKPLPKHVIESLQYALN